MPELMRELMALIRHPVPSHVPQNQGQNHQTQRRAEHASK